VTPFAADPVRVVPLVAAARIAYSQGRGYAILAAGEPMTRAAAMLRRCLLARPRHVLIGCVAVLFLVPPTESAAQQRPGPAVPTTLEAAALDLLSYRYIGPTRGGRVTAVAGHTAQPNTFYFGGVGGGVFRTDDAGETWQPVSDGQIPVGSVGAIKVAPSDSAVIYVGTGSAAIRSNVSIGKGVYKSVDAGRTWSAVGLEKAGVIGDMVVHPANADLVYVAAVGNPFGRNAERGSIVRAMAAHRGSACSSCPTARVRRTLP
jgi:photosystem II stability/assembly factor-like uncharacterized protein